MNKLSVLSNENCPHGCNAQGNILFHGEWVPCPIHGKKNMTNVRQAFSGVNTEKEMAFKDLCIPMEIQRTLESKAGLPSIEVIRACAQGKNIVPSSLKYASAQLERLETMCEKGQPLLESSYFYFGSNVNLIPYAYKLQLLLYKACTPQIPILTISDLFALRVVDNLISNLVYVSNKEELFNHLENDLREKLNSQGLRGLEIIKYTDTQFSDVLTVPILFLIDNKSTLRDEIFLLENILYFRGQRNLPTFIFSSSFPDKLRQMYLMDFSYSQRLSKVSPYIISLVDIYDDAVRDGFYRSPGPLNIEYV